MYVCAPAPTCARPTDYVIEPSPPPERSIEFSTGGHAEYLGYACEDFSFLGSGDFHIAKQFIGGWLLTIFTRQKGPNHLWLRSCPFLPDGLLMSIDVI